MKVFQIIIVIMASFVILSDANRPLITLMHHSTSFLDQIASSNDAPHFGNRLKTCSRPCQRLPNMVKIQSLLIRYGINKNIASLIKVSTMNSYGEVDIGRCAGSCRAVESQIIRVSTKLFIQPPYLILCSKRKTFC